MTCTSELAGSSPLARGPHSIRGYTFDLLGLIPARAGNMLTLHATGASAGAHPRSRGEHLLLGLSSRALMGSSPLARGTFEFYGAVGELAGLIPARAGNM